VAGFGKDRIPKSLWYIRRIEQVLQSNRRPYFKKIAFFLDFIEIQILQVNNFNRFITNRLIAVPPPGIAVIA
jgi:hypothetical protein